MLLVELSSASNGKQRQATASNGKYRNDAAGRFEHCDVGVLLDLGGESTWLCDKLRLRRITSDKLRRTAMWVRRVEARDIT
jgi:hypothetical protein